MGYLNKLYVRVFASKFSLANKIHSWLSPFRYRVRTAQHTMVRQIVKCLEKQDCTEKHYAVHYERLYHGTLYGGRSN